MYYIKKIENRSSCWYKVVPSNPTSVTISILRERNFFIKYVYNTSINIIGKLISKLNCVAIEISKDRLDYKSNVIIIF